MESRDCRDRDVADRIGIAIENIAVAAARVSGFGKSRREHDDEITWWSANFMFAMARRRAVAHATLMKSLRHAVVAPAPVVGRPAVVVDRLEM